MYSILIILTIRTSLYTYYITSDYCDKKYEFTDEPDDNMKVLVDFFTSLR